MAGSFSDHPSALDVVPLETRVKHNNQIHLDFGRLSVFLFAELDLQTDCVDSDYLGVVAGWITADWAVWRVCVLLHEEVSVGL